MALIQVRVEENVKTKVDDLFSELGFDTPTAIRIFLKKALEYQGLPFNVKKSTPNSETIQAMKEAEELSKNPNTKRYRSFSELLAEVEREDVWINFYQKIQKGFKKYN